MSLSDFSFAFKNPVGESVRKLDEALGWQSSTLTPLLLIGAVSALAALYVRHVVSKAAPGVSRLCLVLPVVTFNILVAQHLDSTKAILAKVVVMFIFSWLANFKLLAFCLNRGPLGGPWTTAQLAAILAQPLYPLPHRDAHKKDDAPLSGRLRDRAGDSRALFNRWLVKTAVFAIIVFILFNSSLTPLARDCFQVLGLYCFVGVLMDGPGAVLTSLLEFEIIPTFDQPWLSTSMSDFWGRRWNIPTSHLLRVLIYDPIAEGCWIRDPKASTKRPQSSVLRATGMCCTFLVSGIVHEIILWACQPDGRISGKWLVFFTIQGPLMITESFVVQRGRARGWQLHPWVARLATLPFMMILGHYLFFAAANRDTDTAARVITSCHDFFSALKNDAQTLVHSAKGLTAEAAG